MLNSVKLLRKSNYLILNWKLTQVRDKNAVQEFIREYGILFPVLFDRDDLLKEKIQTELESLKIYLTTPFKIYVNSNHEIIHIEKSTKDVEQQKLFPGRVSRILKMKGNDTPIND